MSEIIKGCLGFKGEKGEHGEVGTPIPYEGTFQELQNSEEDKGRFYIIMDEQDEVYYRHWVYYDEENEQWKDGGEYLANLVINLEDLTQEEWESLKSNLTNYYKRYESVYTTTQENEINIPINISQYNTLAILEVYIEGRMLNRNEYAINGTNSVTLNIPLSEIGTKVHFIVYRSVCASNEDLNELKGPKGDSGAIVFDTIAEMIADEDLVAGDTCQTLGYNSKNDGNGELYNIVDDNVLVADNNNIIELNNGLKAIRIVKTQKLKYYLMPLNNSANIGGDCHILITPNGKVIMIDTGYPTSFDLIKARLNELQITKIDYLIISHYHGDHVGNLDSLKANFDMTETIFYIPPYSSHSDISELYPWTITQIGNNEKIVPTENQIVTIDNVKIKFFNISAEDYTYYDSITNNYNDYSMCCIVNYKDINMLFTGDIGPIAEKRIYSKGTIDVNIDFYKVEHHGTNTGSDSNYLKTLNNPSVAVVSCNNQNFINSATVYDTYGTLKINTMPYLAKNGCKIYCATNNNNFIYETDGKNYNIPNNNNFAQFNTAERANYLDVSTRMLEIYVDNTFTGEICDGTELRPYKTIQEAIVNGIVEGCKNLIIVKNGTYNEDYLSIGNISSHVIIQGESKTGTLIKNIYISNCKALCIKDCTFTDTKDNAVIVGSFSNVEFNNVVINGQTTTELYRGLGIYDSEVKIKNCTISNKSIAIAVNDLSKIYVDGLDGTNNTYLFNVASYGSEVYEKNITATYSDYFFYILFGKYAGQQMNRNSTQLKKMIRDGNAFNSIFYWQGGKPVMCVGGVWKDLMGNNIFND